MGKKILSLCMALALCLSLLPATALAAEGGTPPETLIVGGTDVKNGDYWTTGTDGKLTSGSASSWNVHYDANSNTLILNDAKITGASSENTNYNTVGIYAGSSGDVSLNIELQGENTITSDGNGIYVYPPENGGNASLTITGEDSGSLDANCKDSAIIVQSNSGNASLSIQNAEVEATVTSAAGHGVMVQAGSSSSASLSVEVSSLTATGGSRSGLGIYFYVPSSSENINLTVRNNAIVRANGGIASGTDGGQAVTTDGTGIVFDDNEGTVYGNVTLQEDLTIGEGESLTLAENASLSAGGHNVIVDSGTLDEGFNLGDSVKYTPTITTTSPLSNGTVGTYYEQTLAADGTTPVTWSVSNGNLPTGLNLNGNTISGTPTAAGTSTFTVTADNGYGSDSRVFTLTVDEAGTVHVESVSLNVTTLTLTENRTAQLTATVRPDNAINKNVTWTSSDETVATVDSTGTITAVSEGTANITVTTEDGNFTATCEVTVNPVEYTVTVLTDGSGRASASPSTAAAGEPVTLTATPANGWRFERWEVVSGGVTIENNSFTMPAENVTVRAVFSRVINIPDTYGITVSATDGGSARTSLSNASAGTAITVTATPDEGYELVYITVDGERITGTTFTMPAHDVTVSVYFREIASLPFTDVASGAWYYDAVSYVYLNGLMDGISDTLFNPDAPMTRAMVWAILARIDGQTVTGDSWVETARTWAMSNGVSDGENANSPVTREQLATMLWRFAGESASTYSLAAYTDAASVSDWAATAMRWSIDTGVITGVTSTTLAPQSTASRAHCAAMLMRFCELPFA